MMAIRELTENQWQNIRNSILNQALSVGYENLPPIFGEKFEIVHNLNYRMSRRDITAQGTLKPKGKNKHIKRPFLIFAWNNSKDKTILFRTKEDLDYFLVESLTVSKGGNEY